jgi:hypothetical protein
VSASGKVRDHAVAVTEADGGARVRLRTGQELRIRLGEDYAPPSVSGAGVLRLVTRTGGYPTGRPLAAVLLAVRSGRTTVSSSTEYSCLHATPPCGLPQRVWTLSVTVSG